MYLFVCPTSKLRARGAQETPATSQAPATPGLCHLSFRDVPARRRLSGGIACLPPTDRQGRQAESRSRHRCMGVMPRLDRGISMLTPIPRSPPRDDDAHLSASAFLRCSQKKWRGTRPAIVFSRHFTNRSARLSSRDSPARRRLVAGSRNPEVNFGTPRSVPRGDRLSQNSTRVAGQFPFCTSYATS